MRSTAAVYAALKVSERERESASRFVAADAGKLDQRRFHPRRVEQRRLRSCRRVDLQPVDAAAPVLAPGVVGAVDPRDRRRRVAAEIDPSARVVDVVDREQPLLRGRVAGR